jgi:hypothetical protein
VKLLRLIRRRHLAYELLAEHDADWQPVDHEAWKRALDTITSYAERVEQQYPSAQQWRDAVQRVKDRYPA